MPLQTGGITWKTTDKTYIGDFAVITDRPLMVVATPLRGAGRDDGSAATAAPCLGSGGRRAEGVSPRRKKSKRRSAATWTTYTTLADLVAVGNLAPTDRGFTGHEMLDPVGLVHMNGRVYDPEIGRFLSADPFVQDPSNLQSWNRYSYVINNPLSLTDPSGFFFSGWRGLMPAAGDRLGHP